MAAGQFGGGAVAIHGVEKAPLTAACCSTAFATW
jgi:hypothetical protein